MNNDLISRSAAIEIAMLYCPDDDGSCSKANIDIREMLDDLENLPTVDAEPVRHGRWYQKRISVPKGKGQTYLVWACSLCHKHEKKRSDYCPNCGAKMDAEVEG